MSTTGREKRLDWISLGSHQQMNLDPEEIPLLAGDVSTKILVGTAFSPVETGLRDSNVVTGLRWKAIDQVDVLLGAPLVNQSQPAKQAAQKRSRPVESPVVLAPGQHIRDVPMTFQKGPGRSEVTTEKLSGDQRGGNYLGVSHRPLGRLLMAAGLKHLIGEAVVGNDVGVHRNRGGDSRAVSSSLPGGYRRFPLPTA